MVSHVPMVMMAVVLVATVLRLTRVYKATGANPWALGAVGGIARAADLGFAGSIAALAILSTEEAGAYPANQSVVVLAALLAVVGAMVVVVAQIQMGRAWRIGVRPGDAPQLIEHGLYRYSRNPIYVGILLVGLGIALESGLWWAWVALGVFALSSQAQIKREETHLAASFGAPFTQFCRRVPRWLKGIPL